MNTQGASIGPDELAQLERLDKLLRELRGRTTVQRRLDIFTEIDSIYQGYTKWIYHEENDLVTARRLVNALFVAVSEETKRNDKKMVRPRLQRYEAVYLLIRVLDDISVDASLIDNRDTGDFRSIFKMIYNESIISDANSLSGLSKNIYCMIKTLGVTNIYENHLRHAYTFSNKMFTTLPLNNFAIYENMLIFSKILEDYNSTVFSSNPNELPRAIKDVFRTIANFGNRSWTKRAIYTVLEISNVLMDTAGILHRDLLLEKVFDVAAIFLNRLNLSTTHDSKEAPEFTFFDKLTTMAFPDCKNSVLVDDRVFPVAESVLNTLLSDLRKRESQHNFVIPPYKAPLFAKLLVISEFANVFSPCHVKRSKPSTPLEIFLEELPSKSNLWSSMFIILEHVVKSWSHRVRLPRLSHIATTVLSLKTASLSPHISKYFALLTQLVKKGVLGNSKSVKSEAASPKLFIKELWKLAVGALHTYKAAAFATDLMTAIVENYKHILSPEDDDSIADNICSLLSAEDGPEKLELISLMLTSLEFDELRTCSGTSNKQAGVQGWTFRCQLGEYLVINIEGDVSEQLFQLCCYHPQASRKRSPPQKLSKLEEGLKLCGLIKSREPKEKEVDKKLGSCLILEVVEYITNLLLNEVTQKFQRMNDYFTTIMSFCANLHEASRISGHPEVMEIVRSLLQTVNEGFEAFLQNNNFDSASMPDPGKGSLFVSKRNKALVKQQTEYRFAAEFAMKDVPPEHMKDFLIKAMKLIQIYGDFQIAGRTISEVKEEYPDSHELDLTSTVSFSSFIAEKVTMTIVKDINFVPDIVTLANITKDILEISHLRRIMNKAEIEVANDERYETRELIEVKKRQFRNLIEPPVFALVTPFHMTYTTWSDMDLHLNPTVSEALQYFQKYGDSVPLVIQYGIIKWFLNNSKTCDIEQIMSFIQGSTILQKIFAENERYKLFSKVVSIEAFHTDNKNRETIGFAQLRRLANALQELGMGHRFVNILKDINIDVSSFPPEIAVTQKSNFTAALVGLSIRAGLPLNSENNEYSQKILLPVILSRLETVEKDEMEQLIYECFTNCQQSEESRERTNSACEGVVEQLLHTGEFTRIGFGLTKLFWSRVAETLTTEIIASLEAKEVYIFDHVLFFWDFFPHMRTAIADILHLFPQSRESSTRRGKYTTDEFTQTLKNIVFLKALDPHTVDEREAAIILNHLEGTEDATQPERHLHCWPSAATTFCTRILNALDNKYLALFKDYLPITSFANVFSPFLCSLSVIRAGHYLLDYGCTASNPKADLRFIRTLAECVDGCGLDNLASLNVAGEKFITLGHIFLQGNFLSHAYAIANLAFDKFLGMDKQRNFAGFGGDLPSAEGLWEFLRMVYLRAKNCEALDSLPRHMQDDLNVHFFRASCANQWLQVSLSPVASDEERIWAKWFCGIETFPKGSQLKYLDGVIQGKWEIGYPKSLDTHHKRLYAFIKNQNQYASIFAETLRKTYLKEIVSGDSIPAQKCKELYDLEVITRPRLSEAFLRALPIEELSLLMWKMCRHCHYLGDPNSTLSFSDFKDCFQVSALLLLEKLKNKKAFMAALQILPVIHSITSEDRFITLRLAVKECEIHIEMGHHQQAENKLQQLLKFTRLNASDSQNSQPSPDEIDIGIEIVCLLSKIQADHSSRNVEEALKPLKKLNKCLMTNDKAVQHVYTIALRQLQEMEAYMESPMIKLRKEARQRHKKDIVASRQAGVANAEDAIRNKILNREYSCENEELQRLDEKLIKAACYAVQAAIDLLEFICNGMEQDDPVPERLKDKIIRVIFPLIDLLFRHEDNPDVVIIFESNFSNFPPSIWLPTVPHILPHCFRNGALSQVVTRMMTEILVAYPFHTILPLLSYKYNQDAVCPQRSKVISNLLQAAVRKERNLASVVKDMTEAHEAYRQFVRLPLKKDNIAPEFVKSQRDNKEVYQISDTVALFKKLALLRTVPIPTVTQPIGKSGDYTRDKYILWAQIKPYCVKADGNSSPKILIVRGSNGGVYKMVWKDGESVRQDSLVQDLFTVMSGLLEANLRTYNVVPLDSHSGIIEFCAGTTSIKDLLIGDDSQSGLHHQIHPTESIMAVRKKMNKIQMQDRKIITVEQFEGFLKDVSPVFRHHFYQSFPRVHDWSAMIQQYTKSLAQWSIVCYVIGLGDRHASNVLFDKKTSTFVHIDLGMILEFSRRMLPIPELVPFRLTRDLLDPILVQGIKGNLAHEAAAALDKMKKNKDVILGVASVFLRETISNFRDTADDSQRSFASATAFGRLQAKLTGTDATICPVSAVDQTNRLLAEATDRQNLSKLFSGWLAII